MVNNVMMLIVPSWALKEDPLVYESAFPFLDKLCFAND